MGACVPSQRQSLGTEQRRVVYVPTQYDVQQPRRDGRHGRRLQRLDRKYVLRHERLKHAHAQ
jgi:hypothetical protein